MTEIFIFTDYKKFILKRLSDKFGKTWGQSAKMAEALGILPSRLSQILKGRQDLSLEQAVRLSSYLGLLKLETDYFIQLVHLAKSAGNIQLIKHHERILAKLKKDSKSVMERLEKPQTLTLEDQAQFYSDWAFSGIRLACSLGMIERESQISEILNLDEKRVRTILEFLISRGLVVRDKKRFKMGPSHLHLPKDSPLVSRLHINWRMRAIENYSDLEDDDLAFTAPMSIPAKLFPEIQSQLLGLIQWISKEAAACDEAEVLACLNIDWFKLTVKNRAGR